MSGLCFQEADFDHCLQVEVSINVPKQSLTPTKRLACLAFHGVKLAYRQGVFHWDLSSCFGFPSAFAGRYLAKTAYEMTSINNTSQTRYPPRTCVLAPVAKMLEKRAGATALRPLTRVRAIPFTVPRVDDDGEMSLIMSCAAATTNHQSKSVEQQVDFGLTECNTRTASNDVVKYNQNPE